MGGHFSNLLSLSLRHVIVLLLNCALPKTGANFRTHRALAYFQRMPNNSILLLVVERAFLHFLLSVLAADGLENEDKDDEAHDAGETEKHNEHCFLALLLLGLLVDFYGFALLSIFSSRLPPEIRLDFELESTALLLVIHFLVSVIACDAFGELGCNRHKADGGILIRFRAHLKFEHLGWQVIALSE